MEFLGQVAAEVDRLLVEREAIDCRLKALAEYREIVEGDTEADVPDNVSPIRPAMMQSSPEPTFKRGERTAAIIEAIQTNGGLNRKGIIEALRIKGNKREEPAVSNALAKLKKDGKLGHVDGVYAWLD